MRILYTILFYLLLPVIFLRLLWRSLRQPGYRQRLPERLGFYPLQLKQCIWVHAVSMGETIAAIPLIKILQAHYPNLPLVVTTMTPTGAERVKQAFGDSVHHLYAPYDLPFAVQRFYKAINPVIGIIMETELWPNLLAIAHAKNVPMCLVNARLSAKSAAGYQRIPGLSREVLSHLTLIAAHGAVDAERFIALGANPERVVVTGNIKFDLELPPDLTARAHELRGALGDNRFIWIAASTHEGEEEQILAAHQALRKIAPNALLILVPRHPDRFDSIAKLAEQTFSVARRSQKTAVSEETAVYLGDTMGELVLLYGAVDVAFVGGSLIQRGGHNILEAAAFAKPLMTGPHVFNFAEITALFVNAAALQQVSNSQSLAEWLIKLYQDPNLRLDMGERALAVMNANRGALTKQVALIETVLKS